MQGKGFEEDFASFEGMLADGEWDRAQDLCRVALREDPSEPRYLVLLGILQAKQGILAQAGQFLDQAFKQLARVDGIRPSLTGPVCRLVDPDLASHLLSQLIEVHGAHPCLRPADPSPGSWTASTLAGFPRSSRHWPAMSEVQVRTLLAALGTLPRPASILEWGSGMSSLYFSGKLDPDSEWISVEHDGDWAKFVEAGSQPSPGAKVTIHHVAANAPLRHPDDDGDLRSFKDYVAFPGRMDRKFDFILVDGRARVECLRIGWRILRQEGIMALHDSERDEYREGYPGTPWRIHLWNPGAKEQTRLDLFLKSEARFRTLMEFLEACLPAHARLEAGCGAAP